MEIQSSTFTSKVVSEGDFDYSIIKVFLFLAINFLSLFLGFYFFKIFLQSLNFDYLFYSFLLFSLFFIFSLLNVFLIKSIKKIFWFCFLSSILSLGIFLENFENFLLIGAFIFFIFLFSGFKLGSDFLKNSLKIKFFEVAELVLRKIFFGFLIFFILIFYSYYFNLRNFQFNEKLNNLIIQKVVNLTKPVLYIYFDVNQEEVLLGDFLKSLALKEINKLNSDFKDYMPQLKEKILNETVKKYQINIEEKFKVKLDLNKNLKENLKIGIINYFNQLGEKNKFYFSIGFAIILFIIFNILLKFLFYLYTLISFLIYKFLIVIGFIYVSLEARSREFILMK